MAIENNYRFVNMHSLKVDACTYRFFLIHASIKLGKQYLPFKKRTKFVVVPAQNANYLNVNKYAKFHV